MSCFRAVIAGVLALVILSTTYHVFQIAIRQEQEAKETTLDIALKSFSLIGKCSRIIWHFKAILN